MFDVLAMQEPHYIHAEHMYEAWNVSPLAIRTYNSRAHLSCRVEPLFGAVEASLV